MADRAFFTSQAQGKNFVSLSFTLQGGGTGAAPTLGSTSAAAGDPKGTFVTVGAYTTTGVIHLTTVDPYPNLPFAVFVPVPHAGNGTELAQESPIATQNANNTWTFIVNYYKSGVLADLGTTDFLRCELRFINSGLNP
jgi:hypothetical protein